jgi:hypothetical protein
LEFKFNFRRNILAQHLHISRQRGTVVKDSNNYEYIKNHSYMKLLSVYLLVIVVLVIAIASCLAL